MVSFVSGPTPTLIDPYLGVLFYTDPTFLALRKFVPLSALDGTCGTWNSDDASEGARNLAMKSGTDRNEERREKSHENTPVRAHSSSKFPL